MLSALFKSNLSVVASNFIPTISRTICKLDHHMSSGSSQVTPNSIVLSKNFCQTCAAYTLTFTSTFTTTVGLVNLR